MWVVDRRFQYKYAVTLSVAGGLIAIIFGALMYLAHRDALSAVLAGGEMPPEVAQQNNTLVWLIVGIAAMMASALALVGLLVTHRVAGPVYVMSHYLGVLGRGRYPIMRPLRRGDELQEFFEQFQAAIEALRVREVEEAEAIDHALAQLEGLSTTPEANAALARLRELNVRKRDATDRVDIGEQTGEKSAA